MDNQRKTEMRHYQRINVSGPLAGRLILEESQKVVDCRPYEVSNRGIGIWTPEALRPGMYIQLEDPEKDEENIRLQVRYCQRNFQNSRLNRIGLFSVDSDLDFYGGTSGLLIVRSQIQMSQFGAGNFIAQETANQQISEAQRIIHDAKNYIQVLEYSTDQLAKILESESMDRLKAVSICSVLRNNVSHLRQSIRNASEVEDISVEPWQRISVDQLVVKSMALCQSMFDQSSISSSYNGEVDEPFIKGKPGALMQVMANLFVNAREAIHGREEKWIKVEVIDLGDKVRINIVDSGSIPADLRERVFEPFYSTKPSNLNSRGVGLSTSKDIIEYHRGNMYLDEDAVNTCFSIEMPKLKDNDWS